VAWPARDVELSMPAWMLARWDRQYGAETASRMAGAALQEPETYERGGRIQDLGAQSIVPLLRLEPGQRLLDLCAAPGNKTAQAIEAGARVTACDVSGRRLSPMAAMGADLVVLDGARPLPFSRPFERILVDAPCSGTGTLGRNPEIKWRLQPEDLAAFRERQLALLAQARAVLPPGGLLVYSTCSLEPEENEEVVASVPAELVRETRHRLPGRDPGDGFFAAVIKSS